MKTQIVVAMGLNNAIGANHKLPWPGGSQRADMARFVELTTGKPIIMGRKTYESFPRRPLPNRTNIVITRQLSYYAPGASVVASLSQALEVAQKENPEYCSIIGGGEVYREALDLNIVDTLQVTRIRQYFAADTFFPGINKGDWDEKSCAEYPADPKNQFPYSFLTLHRIHEKRSC